MGRRKLFVVLILGIIAFLPFLGLTEFNTKGEPREAVVAYSMLESGNWILPVNNGGDIAFKPPFFHWCIAAVSAVTGAVTEYTARFPSAVALIVMLVGTFIFYAKRSTEWIALIACCIIMTNFEVHRAAMNCRVDMMLTAFIVLALMALYRWTERDTRGFPWLATLLMGLATLTKGPVGILLPCLVIGVYLWIRGRRFLHIAGKMVVVALASCILPALWYVAAYLQGGDDFVGLVVEENLGRFTGSMSYESHENPIYYNFLTLLSGYAPYTLLVLISLFFIRSLRSKTAHSTLTASENRWTRYWHAFTAWIKNMDNVRLFSMLSAVLIFIFYCIPKSKRSVYLLPIYPFIAYFLAEYIIYLAKKAPRAIRIYGRILSVVALLLPIFFIAVKLGVIPDSIFHGKHAADNVAYLNAIRNIPKSIWYEILFILPVLFGIGFLTNAKKRQMKNNVVVLLEVIFSIFLVVDGIYQPALLNVKSDKTMAAELRQRVPQGDLYQYISVDMSRYFSVNFYNGDSVRLFEEAMPTQGYLLSSAEDLKLLQSKYPAYHFTESWDPQRRSCDTRQDVHLYKFQR
jgi:4-amino-4-deoxy-L-arabinose transferase-like glycosyltransferase